MNFDMRSGEDENFHQNTGKALVNVLPANPADELSDAELESIYAAGIFPFGTTGLAGSSSSFASSTRVHSFSFTCDISVFSLNLLIIPVVNIANCVNQICANDH